MTNEMVIKDYAALTDEELDREITLRIGSTRMKPWSVDLNTAMQLANEGTAFGVQRRGIEWRAWIETDGYHRVTRKGETACRAICKTWLAWKDATS